MVIMRIFDDSNCLAGWLMNVNGVIKYVESRIEFEQAQVLFNAAMNQSMIRPARLEHVDFEYDELGYNLIHSPDVDIDGLDLPKILQKQAW